MLYFSHRTASWPLPRLILLIHALILCFPAAVVAKPYKAGEIYTPEARLYGKYVFSMRSAKGSGVISAFFLWKDGSEQEGNLWEEVDIEVFGKDNAETWQSNIITGMDSSRIVDEAIHEHDFSFGDEFHTFTLEWTPDSLTWYVDGAVVRTEDTVSSEQVAELVSPAQLRFNLWASVDPAWVGDWDDAILPVFMHVDWVEYYAWNDTDGGFESQPLWRDDFDDFDSELWAKADWTFADNRADFIPENAYGRLLIQFVQLIELCKLLIGRTPEFRRRQRGVSGIGVGRVFILLPLAETQSTPSIKARICSHGENGVTCHARKKAGYLSRIRRSIPLDT
jgi:hypothetical protein